MIYLDYDPNLKINYERHIWEGWRVIDFINELLPLFYQLHSNHNEFGFNEKLFSSDLHLKNWLKENQPYYKKHIPEVYFYFKKLNNHLTLKF